MKKSISNKRIRIKRRVTQTNKKWNRKFSRAKKENKKYVKKRFNRSKWLNITKSSSKKKE